MFATEIYQLSYQALLLILILSGPPILISMFLGLLVAIFQAATQINDSSLAFIPKIGAAVIALIFFGNFMISRIATFTTWVYNLIPQLIQ